MIQLPREPRTGSRDKFASAEARWRALERRDPAADGQFVYSVSSTGVYCRPTCPSRLAHREHVQFYATCHEAERAGFRACKRCRPNGKSQREVEVQAAEVACRFMADSEAIPTLAELSQATGLSRFHFQRTFKKVLGVTPRQYAAALRNERMRAKLRAENSVTEAIYSAGFGSSSRFYERATENLGMTPKQFRAGGRGMTIRSAIVPCPLGLVLVAGTERGICFVGLGESKKLLEEQVRQEFPEAVLGPADAPFDAWVNAIVAQTGDPSRQADVPVDVRGTAFQHRVWDALRQIAAGETVSYTELARRIGRPSSVRAVASACARNPIAVVVPCHRVVGKDGQLRGFRWGLARKRQLLHLEAARKKPKLRLVTKANEGNEESTPSSLPC